MENEKNKKRFEDWDDVDCNQCERYWDNSCDGAPLKGSRRACTAFSATRSVIIPLQIKRLERRLEGLTAGYIILTVAIGIIMLVVVFAL